MNSKKCEKEIFDNFEIAFNAQKEMKFSVCYVTAYEVTRHYGGPEEGGWWFNHYEVLATIPVKGYDHARKSMDALKEGFFHLQHGDIHSMAGGVEIRVLCESEKAQYETRQWPVYE